MKISKSTVKKLIKESVDELRLYEMFSFEVDPDPIPQKRQPSLYIMQSGHNGSFKVGISHNPRSRLKQLQTGSPYKIKIIAVIKDAGHREKPIHRHLKRSGKSLGYRTIGEWFPFVLLGSLPDDIYEMLDTEFIDTWWQH